MSATAKVFMSGRSQAIRLPKAFRVKADEVRVEKQGEALLLTPMPKTDWKKFFSEPGVPKDFLKDRRDPPPAPRRVF